MHTYITEGQSRMDVGETSIGLRILVVGDLGLVVAK